MTKFKSLDDIPDALQDFEWASDEISFKEDEYDGEFQSKAQSNDYEDLSPNFQKPVSGGKQNNYLQSHPAGQKEVPTKAGTAKVPPLPYDQSRSSTKNQRAANQLSNQIPVPPSSKYFDYDNGDDNFDDDDEVYSPKSKTFSIQKVNYSAIGGSGAGRRSPEFAPPLPYEANAASDGGKGAVAEQDSIYFSKKPRPINFK